MSLLKVISITVFSNLRIGHTSDHDAKTGVTVLYFPNGAKAGCDISGGGPASRETPLTSPVTADNPINAIVLSGGSAYGLAAADGVMNYLESQNIGYNTGAALVPLVCQSCIYDLSYGDPKIRPTAKMGEEACRQAFAGTDTRTGNIGAGTGATVGKLYGMKQSMKSGLGIAAGFKFIIDGLKLVPSEVSFRVKGYAGEIGTQIYPAVMSVGYICGPRISSYMFAGGIVSWLVLIPAIVLFGSDLTLYPGNAPIGEMFAAGGESEIWGS